MYLCPNICGPDFSLALKRGSFNVGDVLEDFLTFGCK